MYRQLEDQTIAFIGSGMMGGAIIHALVENNELPKDHIIASDPVPKRREELSKRYGIRTTDDNVSAVRDATIVVLAVKPQVLPSVLAELYDRIPSGWSPIPADSCETNSVWVVRVALSRLRSPSSDGVRQK